MLDRSNNPCASARRGFSSVRACQGFTSIELTVAIVLVGALGATALPRFIDFSGEAHQSTVAATAGAFGSAIGMANVACIASG